MNELDLVNDLLSNEITIKPKDNKRQLQYISEEEFIKLGKPKFGYTMAKIAQHEFQSDKWYAVFVDYILIAIKYSRLHWYLESYDWTGTIDEKIQSSIKEIANFQKENLINAHDMRWVEQIAYEEEYNRNKLIAKVKKIKPSIKIPERIKPTFKYVEWYQQKELDVIEELFDVKKETITGCKKHPEFRGLRLRKTNTCKDCITFYNQNKEKGVKETRLI